MNADVPTYLDMEGKPTQGEEGIAVIYLGGPMTVDGGLCSRGIRDTVQDLEELDANDDVKGLIFEVNSGGGSAGAGFMLKTALEEFSKPVVALGHFVGSAAYLAASQADEIVASSKGAMVGSVGTMFSINNKDLEDLRDNYSTYYSNLSGKKNLEIRELMTGNDKPLMKMLDNMAQAFIDEVSDKRTGVKSTALQGELFTAVKAKKLGLIDNIGGRKKAVEILNRHIKIAS